MHRRPALRPAIGALGAAVLAAQLASSPGPARAEDVPVRIDAVGRPFRIVPLDPDAPASALSQTCDAPCVVRVPAGRYRVTIADETEELTLERPTKVRYDPGHPSFRLAGGAVAAGGLLLAGFSLRAALGLCDDCHDYGKTTQVVLVSAAGVGIAMIVFGGIVFFSAGPSIFVDGPKVPDKGGGVPFGGLRPLLAPLPGGAFVGLGAAF